VEGCRLGDDGRIHTQYGRDASTLRFTSPKTLTYRIYHAPTRRTLVISLTSSGTSLLHNQGSILYARDFSGIEAVLTGYFALDPATSVWLNGMFTPTTRFTLFMSWKVEHESKLGIFLTLIGRMIGSSLTLHN
jgi:hypothetical protein